MRFLFIFLFAIPLVCNAQYLIEGNVDTSLQYKIAHLDILDEWNQFGSVTDRMTIKSTFIDGLGDFKFEGDELSDKSGFYRIRYAKKQSGVSINIGIPNYINFVFSNQDTIQIQNVSFVPNNNLNASLKNEIIRHNDFRNKTLNIENERQEELLVSKNQEHCTDQIKKQTNGLLNVYSLATSDITIQQSPELYKKVYEELSVEFTLPQYANSLGKIIHQHDYSALEKNSEWLKRVLLFSLVANTLFLFFWLRNKFLASAPVLLSQIDTLTNKEQEVLKLINDKKTNKEIASALFISEATVKTHINNIYRKLNVNSRKDAIKQFNS